MEVVLPAFKHFAQTLFPFTILELGKAFLLLFLFAWETLWMNMVFLPHIEHTLAIDPPEIN